MERVRARQCGPAHGRDGSFPSLPAYQLADAPRPQRAFDLRACVRSAVPGADRSGNRAARPSRACGQRRPGEFQAVMLKYALSLVAASVLSAANAAPPAALDVPPGVESNS